MVGNGFRWTSVGWLILTTCSLAPHSAWAELLAGVATVDISDYAVPVHDPSWAKALVVRSGDTTAVIVTVDAVAIGEIGRIGNEFLGTIRQDLERELGIPPNHIIVNASHCHAVVRPDVAQLVVEAVHAAAAKLVPVQVRSGSTTESRISENRRMLLKDGTQIDMRRAYAMPPDEAIASLGLIDPQVGIVCLDQENGQPLAILYHFACHPIMNPPSKGSSADFPGVASQVIEQATGATALFVQGCAGDINPVHYKEISRPADAEPLGTFLGAKILAALRTLDPSQDNTLAVEHRIIQLPRADDFETRIANAQAERAALVAALRPTNINFKTFLPLLIQHKLWPDTPSHYAAGYLQNATPLQQLDQDNRAAVESYLSNITIMEQLTRLNTNLKLLETHLEQTRTAVDPMLTVEVCGLRIGKFKWITFPGELTVEIGLNIKRSTADPDTFISGYTNGYIYYTATVAQRTNTGYAQEDCDVLVAPAWQKIFERTASEVWEQLQ